MVAKTRSNDDTSVSEPTHVGSAVSTERILSEAELRDITDMDAAVALIQRTMGAEVVQAREELGDGFEFIERNQKDRLIGIPLLFVKWECSLTESYTRTGENGQKQPIRAVQVWVMYERGGQVQKSRFFDSSTGVCQQLWGYYERTGKTAGLAAPLGLRKSEFTYRDPSSGDESLASTYYIDVSNPNS